MSSTNINKSALLYRGLTVLVNLIYIGLFILIVYLAIGENLNSFHYELLIYGSIGIVALILAMFVPKFSKLTSEGENFLFCLPIIIILVAMGLATAPYYFSDLSVISIWEVSLCYAIVIGLPLTYSFYFNYKNVVDEIMDMPKEKAEAVRFVTLAIALPLCFTIGYFIGFGLSVWNDLLANILCIIIGIVLAIIFMAFVAPILYLGVSYGFSTVGKIVVKKAKNKVKTYKKGVKAVFSKDKRVEKVYSGTVTYLGTNIEVVAYKLESGWLDIEALIFDDVSASYRVDAEKYIKELFKREFGYNVSRVKYVSNLVK